MRLQAAQGVEWAQRAASKSPAAALLSAPCTALPHKPFKPAHLGELDEAITAWSKASSMRRPSLDSWAETREGAAAARQKPSHGWLVTAPEAGSQTERLHWRPAMGEQVWPSPAHLRGGAQSQGGERVAGQAGQQAQASAGPSPTTQPSRAANAHPSPVRQVPALRVLSRGVSSEHLLTQVPPHAVISRPVEVSHCGAGRRGGVGRQAKAECYCSASLLRHAVHAPLFTPPHLADASALCSVAGLGSGAGG